MILSKINKLMSQTLKASRVRSNSSVYRFITFATIIFCILGITWAGYNSVSARINDGDHFISVAQFGETNPGTPMVSSDHTNILKIPFLALQNILPQNIHSYALVSAALVVIMTLLWSYLISSITLRETFPLLTALLTSLVLISPELASTLFMVTIRHIEYPIMLVYLLVIQKYILNKSTPQNNASYWIYATILLSLLIINDKLFLYALVPVLIVFYTYRIVRNEALTNKDSLALTSVIASVILSKLTLLLLQKFDLLYSASGYINTPVTIRSEQLVQSLTNSFEHLLQLMGGNIFGLVIGLTSLFSIAGLAMFVISVVGALAVLLNLKNQRNQFILFSLIGFASMCMVIYIATGSALSSGNIRYLSGVIVIMITYGSIFVTKKVVKMRNLYFLLVTLVVAIGCLGLLKNLNNYVQIKEPVRADQIRTQKTYEELRKRGVKYIVSGGGHHSLWYESNKYVNIAVLAESCNQPSPWANHTHWISPANERRTAFLVDQTYPEKASLFCGINQVQKIYGPPLEIVPVTKPNETNKTATTFLLIYNYDIRTKLLRQ